jgi:arsenate reductase
MPLKVYQYPKCSTCRNALKWLDANNLAHTDIDITEQPPSKSELNEMLAHYDGDLRRLFNTSDQMYRALKIKDRLPEMKPPEAIDLLAANGMLINAPSSSPTKPASSALRKTNGRPHCPERTISVTKNENGCSLSHTP